MVKNDWKRVEKGIYLRGDIYWISYSNNGKLCRESVGTSKTKARDALAIRKADIAKGEFTGLDMKKVRWNDLIEDIKDDYRIEGRKSLDRLEFSLKHLEGYFTNRKVVNITSPVINQYIIGRQKEGAANSTINRELSALNRMLVIGSRQTPPKVLHVPHIPKLQEDNVRTGYITHEEYVALRDALPSYLKPVVIVAYYTGMRKEEILNLIWDKVDMTEGKIILEDGDVKNGKGRIIYLTGEVFQAFLDLRIEHGIFDPENPYLFTRNGKPFHDFRHAWKTACKKVGLEGLLFHDLRRTAIRNMIRSGVKESVAMRISGHKTREIFDRYNIVDEEDLQKASEKLNESLNPQPTE